MRSTEAQSHMCPLAGQKGCVQPDTPTHFSRKQHCPSKGICNSHGEMTGEGVLIHFLFGKAGQIKALCSSGRLCRTRGYSFKHVPVSFLTEWDDSFSQLSWDCRELLKEQSFKGAPEENEEHSKSQFWVLVLPLTSYPALKFSTQQFPPPCTKDKSIDFMEKKISTEGGRGPPLSSHCHCGGRVNATQKSSHEL